MKFTIKFLVIVLLLVGCSTNEKKDMSQQNPETIITWNKATYTLTNEILSSDQIGNEIGKVEEAKTLNCPECKAPLAQAGNKLYEIRGIDSTQAIAIGLGSDYYKIKSKK